MFGSKSSSTIKLNLIGILEEIRDLHRWKEIRRGARATEETQEDELVPGEYRGYKLCGCFLSLSFISTRPQHFYPSP